MSTTIVIDRPHLLARLREQEARAKDVDKQRLEKHRRECAEVLKLFRDQLRTALKWTAEEAEARYFQVQVDRGVRQSIACPRAEALRFTKALDALALDRREQFRLAPGNDLHKLVTWVPDDDGRDRIC